MSIKISEYSKKIGMSSGELLSFLQEQGFDVSNENDLVPKDALNILDIKKNSDSGVSVSKIKKEPSSTDQTREIIIDLEPMTLLDFSQQIDKPISEIILSLLKLGIMSSKNQILSEDIITKLAQIYEIKLKPKTKKTEDTAAHKAVVKKEGNWIPRPPIIVIIGHVDHGKTTLLDYIRKTRVAAKEKGGITQHLGAYEVDTSNGKLVFLDTPGHEAFGIMRLRGIKIADIAVLIVAADDGVKPQTIEALKHAKAVGLPIVVAINKIDKATQAQIDSTMQQLAQHDLVAESWGGNVVVMPISAKEGKGVTELLDVLILQAQLMELEANISVPAKGFILESKLEKGRGPVATVICQHGILHVGDHFIAGMITGKVNSLVDSFGKKIDSVSPSIPVQVAGFNQLSATGDKFEVLSHGESKKLIKQGQATLKTDLSVQKKSINVDSINIIIKTDNASSKEALISSVEKLSSKLPKQFNIVSASIGDVTENDIYTAKETDSIIYAFHVKLQQHTAALVQKETVTIKYFDIIYKLLEDLEDLAELGKPIKMVSKKIGEAVVLKVFDIKNLGIIAGSQVKTGRFVKDGKVVVYRGKSKVGQGSIKGLQREKKSVKEVHSGFEFGILIEGFDQWEVDDRIECYQEVPA